jgi:hypothetical protein
VVVATLGVIDVTVEHGIVIYGVHVAHVLTQTLASLRLASPLRKEAWDDARVVVAVDIAVLATTVSEPQSSGGYMSKHVTYLIRTEPYTYLVRRRYSDFVWLREALQRRFIGMLLPSLPPKTYSSSSTSNTEKSSHVKHRMRMLGLFLQNLVEIPYVRGDASVLAFLSVQNESEFDSARTATALPDLFSDTSAGAVKWRDALRSAEIPHNGQRVLMDFISQLEYLEAHLKKLVVSAKSIADKAIAKRAEIETLGSLFTEWTKTEEEFGNNSKFEYPNKTSAGMTKVLTASQNVLAKWAQVRLLIRFFLCFCGDSHYTNTHQHSPLLTNANTHHHNLKDPLVRTDHRGVCGLRGIGVPSAAG